MKLQIVVTPAERTMIVAALTALTAYGSVRLASDFNARAKDPTDDGPEVTILRVGWNAS